MTSESLEIGVISDTHGQVGRLQEAAETLRRRGVAEIVHCGDITTPGMVDVLSDFEVHWVFGNCDFDERGLRSAMSRCGHFCHGVRGEIVMAERSIAFTHGHQFTLLKAMLCGGEYDLVFHGHTHSRRDEIEAGTRVICPGALHHVEPSGFVIVDLSLLEVEWVEVSGLD